MTPPDSRGWVIIGLFVTFLVLFGVRALVPGLKDDQTVNAILVSFATGGPLLVASYYFGSSKDKPPQ